MRSKERKRWRRYLSILLVVLLVFSMVSSGDAKESGEKRETTENTKEVIGVVTKEKSLKPETGETSTSEDEAVEMKTSEEPETAGTAVSKISETESTTSSQKMKETDEDGKKADAAIQNTKAADTKTETVAHVDQISENDQTVKKDDQKVVAHEEGKNDSTTKGQNDNTIKRKKASLSSNLADFITDIAVYVNGKDPKEAEIIEATTKFQFAILLEEKQGQKMDRIVTYQLPKESLVNWPENGKIDGREGATAGKYTVDKEGKVTLTFDENYYNDVISQGLAKGTFYFEAGIKGAENQEEVKIDFPGMKDGISVSFNIAEKVLTSKSGSYDKDTGKFTFSVEAKAIDGMARQVVIQDTLGSDLQLAVADGGKYQLTYYPKKAGAPESGTVTLDESHGFAVDVGDLGKDQTARLTYTAELTDEAKILWGKGQVLKGVSNKAKATTPKDGDEENEADVQRNDITDFDTTVSKKVTKREEDHMEWKVTLQVPKEGGNYYVEDRPYFTDKKSGKDILLKINDISAKIEGTDETIPCSAEFLNDEKWPMYSIVFGADALAQTDLWQKRALSSLPSRADNYKVEITYTTPYEKADGTEWENAPAPGNTIKNDVIFGEDSRSVSAKIPYAPKCVKNLDRSKDAESDFWAHDRKIPGTRKEIKEGKTVQTYRYYIELDSEKIGLDQAVVTDSYSPNLTLFQDEFCDREMILVWYDWDINDTVGPYGGGGNVLIQNKDVSVDEKNHTFTVDLTDYISKINASNGGSAAYTYRLYYAMELNEEVANQFTTAEGVEISNEAVIAYDGGPGVKASAPKVTYKNYPIKKEMLEEPESKNDYKGTFKITVTALENLLQDGNLVIEDKFTNLDLSLNSIKVFSGAEELAKENYLIKVIGDNHVQIIIKNVSKGSVYSITYDAEVVGEISKEVDYSNEASIPGNSGYMDLVETRVDSYQLSGSYVGTNVYTLQISKFDNEDANKKLSGAEFHVYEEKSDGEVILLTDKDKPLVTNENGTFARPFSPSGQSASGRVFEAFTQYYLQEVKAPEGYRLEKDKKFYFYFRDDSNDADLNEKEKDLKGKRLLRTSTGIPVFEIGNDRNENNQEETVSVTGKKTWNDGGNRSKKRPEKISIQLLKNGEPMEGQRQEVTVTDKDEGSWSFDKLPKYDENGKEIVYSIREDAVPGYIGKVSGYNVTNTITSVPVRKVDIAGGTVLEGAALQVLDKDGNVVAEWVSEAKDYVVEGLLTKTPYTLHEVSAPEGYELAPDTKFQLKEDGTVEILDKNETATVIDEEGRLVIGDKRTETVEEETVSVTGKKTWNDGGNRSKKRPEKIFIQLLKNGEPMEGQRQEVTVTDKDEGSWSFDKLPKYDENGKEIVYSIREDAVPGYIGKVSGYDVTNTITSVPVRKVDIAGGTALEGAALQVLDKDGNVVAEWVSEAKDYVVEGLLTETPYTLHEVKAPEGYGLAPDTVFWLNDDGTVNVDKGTAACENGVILVEDKYVQTEDTSVSVVKTVSYNGLPLVAEGISFYVGLYYDEGCTKMAAPYKEIRLEKASSTKVTFDNLEVGRTYYVGECDNKGNMISSGEVSGVVYQAKFTGTGGNRVVTSRGENVQVALDNQMAELPDGFYIEGQLHVTKKVLNVNGKPMNTSKVFYAGIFEDAGHTKLSSLVENNILTLAPEGTSEAVNATTVAIPDKDAVVKLYVAETDASGKPVAGTSGFSYEVTVTGEAAVLTVQNSEAYVSITNRVKEKIHEKEKIESKSENNKKTKNTGTSGKAKTSDNTPILPMAVLFLLSVSGAVWILYRRRRSQK